MTTHEEALHSLEKRALLLDRDAVVRLISMARSYRAATEKLLGLRYGDGTCDGATVNVFADEWYEAEAVALL